MDILKHNIINEKFFNRAPSNIYVKPIRTYYNLKVKIGDELLIDECNNKIYKRFHDKIN